MSAPGLRFEGTLWAETRAVVGPLGFAVAAGRWTCLLGPSGVGKSSILQAFAGGGLRLEGVASLDDGRATAGHVALMAQDAGLWPWLTAAGNVAAGARLRGERVDRARALALLDRVGLSAVAERPVTTLSGGQQQRVALARTLYEDRPVVLLDEPFSALDVATRLRVQDRARDLLAGRTVLHVTHDPGEAARLADHVLLLGPEGLTRHDGTEAARLTDALLAVA